MFCTKCSQRLRETAQFCTHCGKPTSRWYYQEHQLAEWLTEVTARQRIKKHSAIIERLEFRLYDPVSTSGHLRRTVKRYVLGLTRDDVLLDVRRTKGYLRAPEFQKIEINYYDYKPLYRQRFPHNVTPRDFLRSAVQDDIVATIADLLEQYHTVRVLLHNDYELTALRSALNRYVYTITG